MLRLWESSQLATKDIAMSDQTNVPSQAPEARYQHRRGRIRRAFWTTVLVVAAAFAGAYANSALSYGPGHWHRGAMFAPFDPARAQDRADRMVRHLAIELDATSEQQERLRAIMKATVADLLPMREQAVAARVKARDLLTRESVNRSELERFRAEQVALADAFSRRLAQALGDAAEVLTPEQRRKLNDHLPSAGRFGPHWRRW
jgi:Spy/CpxP family protein refolding chaperone